MTKEDFMRLALKEAEIAKGKGEIPIGAIVVKDGKVIGKGHNQRNETKIATNHAEIIAINEACKNVGDWRIEGDIYVTLEPCAMCAGAINNARINKIYFGAYEKKSGAVLSKIKLAYISGLNHECKVEGGVLYKECSEIMKDFFGAKR